MLCYYDPKVQLIAQEIQPLDAQEVDHDIRVGNNDYALFVNAFQ